MSFVVDSNTDCESWDFIVGDYFSGMSIMVTRFEFLRTLDFENDGFKVAFRDPKSNKWSKWQSFPGLLIKRHGSNKWDRGSALVPVYDVHRSILENEIVIESDYVDYEKNYEAARLIGSVLEAKGYIPHYYYSGNKSVHIHVYFDLGCLLEIDMFLQDQLIEKFKHRGTFVKKFMTWIREQMITCWGMNIRDFDKNLIRSNHLIRAELSRNKKGYKTFLGYACKDLSFVPYVCNEENRIYPKLGEIKVSRPEFPQEIIEEFLESLDTKNRLSKVRRKESSLQNWIDPESATKLKKGVKYILSDNFKKHGDGFKRGMFILANELKRIYGPGEAIVLLKDWNKRMGYPINDDELEYRMTTKGYTFVDKYVDDFLESIGAEC